MKLRFLAIAALVFVGLPWASSSAQIGISVAIAPPAIPVYEQPPCPVEGYLWTPGYWAYSDVGYYWVPGVWIEPPRVGVLWTPGYWGYNGSVYAFNEGYWGPTVGFYGGIDYGFGYGGHGYYGGEWSGSSFRYNTAVTRVDTTVIHNTYVNKTVVSSSTASRPSFNGPGGVKATATAQEQAAMKAEHTPPTTAQRSREQAASKNPDLLASTNHGQPKTEAIKALDASNGQKPATSEKQSAAKTKVSSQPATKATQTHDAAVKSVQSKGTHPVQTHRPSQTLSRKTVPARAPVQPAAKKKPAKGPPGSAQ